MSIFSAFFGGYNRPGPGVRPDEPRKKGLARLIEMLGRDFWAFFRAGFLAFLGMIPFIFGMILAITSHAVIFVLAAGLIGGMIAAPELCGMADTVLRSLRDEPGYWWTTYRRAWKRNAKACLLPGAIFGLVIGMQIFTLFHMNSLQSTVFSWAILIAGMVLVLGLITYIIPQIALLDMSFAGILKNAVLLFLGYLPRSIGTVAVQVVYWGVFLLFFPVSLYILPFTNLWLPMVPSLLIIYIPMEKSFNLEATIKQMRDDKLEKETSEES